MLFKIPTESEDKLFTKLDVRSTDLAAAMGNRGQYWLADYLPHTKKVYCMDREYNESYTERFDAETLGVRLLIPAEEAKNIKSTGVYFTEYGEYPQDAVTEELSKELDEKLYKHKLKSTGKEYTLPFGHHQSKCGEYEYNEKKYVKVSDVNCWFEVQPIIWLKDSQTGAYMSQMILLTSKWNDYAPDDKRFDPDNIYLKVFLRDVFAKEIMPQTNQIQVQQLFPNQNVSGQQAVNNAINQALSLDKIADVQFTIPDDEILFHSDYIEVVNCKSTDVAAISNGCFWIDSQSIPKPQPRMVKAYKSTIFSGDRDTFYGVRPMISSKESQKIRHLLKKVGETRLMKKNIYELGEFPQDKVDAGEAKMLELKASLLQPTSKTYHSDYIFSGQTVNLKEYVYNKTKYARSGDNFYRVKPIRWVEGPDGCLLAEDILLTSVWGSGADPEVILNGLNTRFAKEIIPEGNNMQNSNFHPQIINEHEIGDGITISDMTLMPDSESPDVQDENNGWFQSRSKSQAQSSSVSSSGRRQIPVSGGETEPAIVDADYEEIDEVAAELDRTQNQNQKGAKKMNNNSKNSVVVVDETPMSVNEQIEFYVKNGMSFMLHGPSGIGKTARVEQIDPDLTAVPLWNGVLPEDIVGKVRYPSGQEVAATEEIAANGVWVEPDWYVELKRKCAAEPEKMHVLFIDEVTNARPTTQSLIFHLTLKKSITPSKGKLPENSVVVLAGNNRNESEAAYNMPEPLFRRMSGHIYLEPNVREWMVWGSESSYKHPEDKERTNIHPLVTSFVGTYGNDVFYSEYNEEESRYALDPRGWEQISDIIYNNRGVIRKELLVAKMGNELASNFMAFAKIPQLSVEDVVSHNYDARSLPQSQDARLALTLNLRHADDKQQKEVRRFISENLGKEYCSVFDAARSSSELAAKNKGMAFKLGGWGRNG